MKKIIEIVFFATIVLFFNCNGQNSIENINSKSLSYLFVDEVPKFPNGRKGLNNYLVSNLKWPSSQFDGAGKVILSFVIDIHGDVTNIRVEKKLCASCDEEAKRVVSLMPKWEPGKIDNNPVNVLLYFPIEFKME